MPTKTEITEKDLQRLLVWLADDSADEAHSYERMRAGLIRFFEFRGCGEAETLADETLNRVAVKLEHIEFDGRARKSTFVYAFAARIFLEYRKAENRHREKAERIAEAYRRDEPAAGPAAGAECLENCLARQSPESRALLLEYFGGEGKAAARRRALAEAAGVSVETLHTRVSRLRATVADCVRRCLNEGAD